MRRCSARILRYPASVNRYVLSQRIRADNRRPAARAASTLVRRSSPQVAVEALQPVHRAGVPAVDAPVHRRQRQAPSTRDGRRVPNGSVPPATVGRRVRQHLQNQALSALLFLYRDVLGVELPWMVDMSYAPNVHGAAGAVAAGTRQLLAQMDGRAWLIMSLLYGTGMPCGRRAAAGEGRGPSRATKIRARRQGGGIAARCCRVAGAMLVAEIERVRVLHAAATLPSGSARCA